MMFVYIFSDCFNLYDYGNILTHQSANPLSNYDFSLYLPGDLPVTGQLRLAVTAVAGDEQLTSSEEVLVNFNAPPTTGNVQVRNALYIIYSYRRSL